MNNWVKKTCSSINMNKQKCHEVPSKWTYTFLKVKGKNLSLSNKDINTSFFVLKGAWVIVVRVWSVFVVWNCVTPLYISLKYFTSTYLNMPTKMTVPI